MSEPTTALQGKEILLGVTGGIAAYKAVEVLRRLRTAGAGVSVVMTAGAQAFVAPLTFQTLSNRPVGTSLFDPGQESEIGHIRLAERADAVLVAPCTAHCAAKLRAGLADDLLSTALLATDAPIWLALAMNDRMWAAEATRENLAVLEGRGVHLIPPEEGFLAEGRHAVGRLAEPERIVAALGQGLAAAEPAGGSLRGRRVLVTAGPTHEPIDPVRFISNPSSGRMGFALAGACRAAGARVTLVHGPVALTPPPGVEAVAVRTAAEMREAVMARRADHDAFILAAAVSDYRTRTLAPQKIKRGEHPGLTLELEPNPDIAAEVGAARSPGQVLVIFAAESERLLDNARAKLEAKHADLICANDITQADAGFESPRNRITLLSRERPEQPEALPLQDKAALGRRIAAEVAALLERRGRASA